MLRGIGCKSDKVEDEDDELVGLGDKDVLDFFMLAKQFVLKQYCFKRQTCQSVHDNPN